MVMAALGGARGMDFGFARRPVPERELSIDHPVSNGCHYMNWILLLDRLGQAERHIREGERHILRQREIIDELERHGRGQTRTANMAREILLSFEMTQSKIGRAHV